jgi:hypothetical protein
VGSALRLQTETKSPRTNQFAMRFLERQFTKDRNQSFSEVHGPSIADAFCHRCCRRSCTVLPGSRKPFPYKRNKTWQFVFGRGTIPAVRPMSTPCLTGSGSVSVWECNKSGQFLHGLKSFRHIFSNVPKTKRFTQLYLLPIRHLPRRTEVIGSAL